MNGNPEVKIPSRIVELFREANNVVLLTHAHPDGDALGSLLGLKGILEGFGKNVLAFLEDPVSHLYDFLPGVDTLCHDLEEYRDFVARSGQDILHVGLDCGDSDRLGRYADEFLGFHPFVVIDHHRSHKDFGDLRWVEPTRSSTGEMVFELGIILGGKISYQSAYCLYVAICTDTGSFRYECTRPRTMEVASELLALGVKPAEVGRQLYDNYSRERLKLMELTLATLELYAEHRIAVMHVSPEMLEESGASIQDVEGFIDLPRSLRSVDVAVLIKQAKPDVVAVSLRAKGGCDVSRVAKHFNGGGHRNAAGFRIDNQSIDEVRKVLLEQLQTALGADGKSEAARGIARLRK